LGCTEVALSELGGAAALLGGALEEALDGGVALGEVEGACAQTGVAIARTAASATPLNRCFIIQPPNRTTRAI
jgi:hypothetical protein